jgi:hypothetical protein
MSNVNVRIFQQEDADSPVAVIESFNVTFSGKRLRKTNPSSSFIPISRDITQSFLRTISECTSPITVRNYFATGNQLSEC